MSQRLGNVLATDRSETIFADSKPRFTKEQAQAEALRCLYCTGAPCVTACPTHIDIPQFIRKIATDNVRGSARTILDANILGQSCARVCPVEVLCVGACVHNHQAIEPIAIGRLQRYATDRAAEAGWQFFTAGADTGKSVGIIGGGPAGLACAHELRRFGHAVTIYEKRAQLGGLNTSGIAPYKLKAEDALREVESVLAIGGIQIKLDCDVGKTIALTELATRHDAMFLGVGLGTDTTLALPGARLPGIVGAVDWIEQMKLGLVDMQRIERAVVIGGGNTAMDVLRELRGLGVPSVTMIYRGDEAQMSGYQHEWQAAEIEGVLPSWRTQPTEFVGSARVMGVRCVKLSADRKPLPNSEFLMPADLVVLAIGQSKLGDALRTALPALQLDNGAPRVRDDFSLGPDLPGWFAGGDLREAHEVVNAVADGKHAAQSIHRFLSSQGAAA